MKRIPQTLSMIVRSMGPSRAHSSARAGRARRARACRGARPRTAPEAGIAGQTVTRCAFSTFETTFSDQKYPSHGPKRRRTIDNVPFHGLKRSCGQRCSPKVLPPGGRGCVHQDDLPRDPRPLAARVLHGARLPELRQGDGLFRTLAVDSEISVVLLELRRRM